MGADYLRMIIETVSCDLMQGKTESVDYDRTIPHKLFFLLGPLLLNFKINNGKLSTDSQIFI